MKSVACSKLWTDISIKLNDQNLTNCCKYKALNQYTTAEIKALGADAFSKNPELFADKLLMTKENKLPKGCSDCSSNWPNSFWHVWNTWRETDWSEEELQALPEQDHGAQIEIYLSNKCNLACMYCNEVYSSKWGQIKNIPAKEIDQDWGAVVLDALVEYVQRANGRKLRIVFLGGEPLMDVRIFEVIERLVAARIQSRMGKHLLFQIIFVTNLSVQRSRVERLLEVAERFPQVNWTVNPSIDAIGSVAEEIRDGLSWELFESNLDFLLTKKIEVILGPAMSALSIPHYPQFVAWAIRKAKTFGKNRFGVDWFIAINSVAEPSAMHPGILPDEYKASINQAIEIIKTELPASHARDEHINHLLNIEKLIGTRRQADQLESSAQWYRSNGLLKNKDYFKVFPLLPEILVHRS